MSRVLAIEIRRALARRFVRVLVSLALVGIVLLAAGFALNSTRRTERQTFSTGTSIVRHDDRYRLTSLWLSDAEQAKRGEGRGGEGLLATSTLFLVMAMVGGGSFVGAEFKAGTVATMLTWEPRRVRVLLAKLGAAALVAGAAYLVLQALFIGTMAVVATLRGVTDGADTAFWSDVVRLLARGAVLTGMCAVLGGCVAAIGRNTSAAFGAVLAVLVGIELVLRGVKPSWAAWFLTANIGTFLPAQQFGGSPVPTVAGSVGYMVVLVGGLIAVTTVIFRRRDV